MVKFDMVGKVYEDGTEAVRNLNLEIQKGEFVVLIGPSGCGKTTTLKMINRLEEGTFGKIYVDGKDITTVDPVTLRRGIGYVIQDTSLMPHMTVEENIAMVPHLLKWDNNKISKRVDELLEMAGLPAEEYKYRFPSQMSGGQKQRIGVLRGLAAEPEVVLMDEPFGALDPISRENLQNELLALQRKLKKTIIFVTHDIDEALKLADKVVLMRQGNIEQIGSPYELQNKPANKFVQDFIGEDRLSQISPDAPLNILVEEPHLTVKPNIKASIILEELENVGRETAQVVDKNGIWVGMISISDIKRVALRGGTIKEAASCDRKLSIKEGNLRKAAEMLSDKDQPIPVIDGDQKFIGVITSNGLARLAISRLKRKQ